jgi:hypothetical protein
MMSENEKVCPECGATMGDKQICNECGYDATKVATVATKSDKKPLKGKGSATKISKGDFWSNYEKYLVIYGKWAWLNPLIFAVVYLIFAIVLMASSVASLFIGTIVWELICVAVSVVFAILWVRPKFSNKCANREWQALVDDAIVIRNIKIPKMLLVGVIVEIFGYGWSGALILGPALLIIFLAPVTFSWKVEAGKQTQKEPKPAKVKPVKEAKAPKPTKEEKTVKKEEKVKPAAKPAPAPAKPAAKPAPAPAKPAAKPAPAPAKPAAKPAPAPAKPAAKPAPAPAKPAAKPAPAPAKPSAKPAPAPAKPAAKPAPAPAKPAAKPAPAPIEDETEEEPETAVEVEEVKPVKASKKSTKKSTKKSSKKSTKKSSKKSSGAK